MRVRGKSAAKRIVERRVDGSLRSDDAPAERGSLGANFSYLMALRTSEDVNDICVLLPVLYEKESD